MTRKPPTDLAASVRERLRQVAATRGQEPQLVLTRYGVERFLYRLSRIPAGEDPMRCTTMTTADSPSTAACYHESMAIRNAAVRGRPMEGPLVKAPLST